MSKDKVACVDCKSLRTWKKGEVPSRTGPKQRYVCYPCGRTFYEPVKARTVTAEDVAIARKRLADKKALLASKVKP